MSRTLWADGNGVEGLLQKLRLSFWASNMRRTLSLSFKSWEESWLALNLCYTIPGQTLNYFSIQSNLDKMTAMSLMMMTSKITLPTTAIATRYSTRYSDFLLLLDSNSTRSKKPLLDEAWDHYIFPNYHYGSPAGRATEDCEPILIHRASNTDSCQRKHKHGSSGDAG